MVSREVCRVQVRVYMHSNLGQPFSVFFLIKTSLDFQEFIIVVHTHVSTDIFSFVWQLMCLFNTIGVALQCVPDRPDLYNSCGIVTGL